MKPQLAIDKDNYLNKIVIRLFDFIKRSAAKTYIDNIG